MRPTATLSARAAALLAACALFVAAPVAHAATITIVNIDGANEGFNDPTPAAPVGGNPGLTIGQQRLNVFQHAANIWGGLLPSNVEIRVRAQFNPQSCTATSGVLGSAGPTQVFRDFTGAILPGHWYHVALANKLFDADLSVGTDDINTTFNSSIGGATCLPAGWYYGLDGNAGTAIELLPVVLHELGHGLGFSTVTSGSSGAYLSGFPAVYDNFLLDLTQNLHWNQMTQGQRAASAVNCQKVVWDGPAVTLGAPSALGPLPLLRVQAPSPVAGDYQVGLAQFGPALTPAAVSGEVVLVDDGVAAPSLTDGCEPIVNNVAGKIALIDRGTCSFVIKVKNAQDAGAIGVIIADNAAGCPPAGLGGTDPTITIPSVRVTQADGVLLKANLPFNASLLADPARKAGADANGRVLVYTPIPFASGSSVSHWDTSAEPSLLMEPAITDGLSSDVDLTLNHFSDIGWLDIATPVFVAPGRVLAQAGRVRVEWASAEALSARWTAYRRTQDGPWVSLGAPQVLGDRLIVVEDVTVEAGVTYAYRLGALRPDGHEEFSGEVTVQVPSDLAFALDGARPNPSGRDLVVSFTLPSAREARLELVDVTGRLVRSIEVGSRGAGRHLVPLGRGLDLAAGTYFLRLTQEGRTITRPAVVLGR